MHERASIERGPNLAMNRAIHEPTQRGLRVRPTGDER